MLRDTDIVPSDVLKRTYMLRKRHFCKQVRHGQQNRGRSKPERKRHFCKQARHGQQNTKMS